jgi:hypothetical protein
MKFPAEELQNDKQDSIEINRTARGSYTWKIKRYYDKEKTNSDDVIKYIEEIDKELKKKFGEGKNE